MNSSSTSFAIFSGVLLLLSAFPAILEGAPNSQVSKPKPNSIVFNVWEFARVAGPPRPRPNVQAFADESFSAGTVPTPSTSSISPCVWGIASCCDATSPSRRNSCFEAIGCPGAWFNDLCSKVFMQSALNTIRSRFGN